ncbi:unnamed protein product [Rotaria sordida]|uniref:L-Fucosyltransferase n=1 Tax=Rotaria sordida TaxID=392033 RepID=A0A819ZHQ3_9BILA|nr:unnamed protein product [Rotaria sordida]CAF1253943.1 unnamed protein product [Rotaria sordida]CAF3551604.1 unnamed protein product [Rotaria sordida]CAF4172646.1 unnamed protein product [Rotaria sordida]
MNRSTTTCVGIHIRRGDFLLVRRASSDQYILNAMNHFVSKYHLVRFIIATDDKSYCRKLFNKRNDVIFTPNSFSAAHDLTVLTLCDHLIITVGTFGWWGAFLNNKTGEILTDSKADFSPIDVNCARDAYFPYWFSFLNHTI